MKELRILYDFGNGPIWKNEYDTKTGKWLTGIEIIDNDKALSVLDAAANEEYNSLYSFTPDGGYVFNQKLFNQKKPVLLSLIQTIVQRINSLNDGSFRIIDEETKNLM
jgi:hypothetical protein